MGERPVGLLAVWGARTRRSAADEVSVLRLVVDEPDRESPPQTVLKRRSHHKDDDERRTEPRPMTHLVDLWALSTVLVASVTWIVAGLIGALPNRQGGAPVPTFLIALLFGILALVLALIIGHE